MQMPAAAVATNFMNIVIRWPWADHVPTKSISSATRKMKLEVCKFYEFHLHHDNFS